MTIAIKIPGAAASHSKMQRKGWKCWAKVLTNVKTPANTGYDYEGSWITLGAVAELELGDVVLHVDDSSDAGVGVLIIGSKGTGYIHWMRTTQGKWAGALAATARKLLSMPVQDRVKAAAQHCLDGLRADSETSPEKLHYYETLADCQAK
jgi:hypothetical protein